MLTIRSLLSVLVFIFRILFTTSFVGKSVFVVEKERKISTSWYQAYHTHSIEECVAFCQVSVECTAANYKPSTRICYLFSKICFRTENVPGWKLIRLPLARRTFQHISDRKETWADAKSYCKMIGGDLANIYSLTDYEMIISTLRPLQNDTEHVWMAGSDISFEGEWTWTNGCRFVDQDFNLWRPNQPNNWNENQHCLAIELRWYQLNDKDCAVKRTFVCEINVA